MEFIIMIMIIISYFPLLGNKHWVFRAPNFLRIQLMILITGLSIFWLMYSDNLTAYHWGLGLAALVTAGYHGTHIFPYTRFTPVISPKGRKGETTIKILLSNVLQPNEDKETLKALIQEEDPDIILLVETDKEWEEAMSILEETHPFTVKVPQDNLYGMHLYSRIEFRLPDTRFLVEDGIPSIKVQVQWDEAEKFDLYCLHPAPPSPTENPTSKPRDEELLLIAKEVRASDRPSIVFGDMNDVAWSATSRRFRKTGNMQDPRIGRGLFSTFHAGYFFLRFPVDQLFHTGGFTIHELRRLKNVGSDHFPMIYCLGWAK